MIDLKRRTLLKGSLGTAVVALAAGAGLLSPKDVLAVAWPKNAFSAKTVNDAVKDLYSNSSLRRSKAILIKAPLVAENGSSVGIAVSSSLPKTDSLTILIERNAQPLAAKFAIPAGTDAFVRTQVKISRTTDIHAVARANGKLYVAKRHVKVTIGGCGG